MLKFKPVGIEDRDLLLQYLHVAGQYGCDNSFVNYFLWQEAYQVEIALFRSALITKGSHWGSSYFAVPLGLKKEDYPAMAEELMTFTGGKFQFEGVYEDQIDIVKGLFPQAEFTLNEDNSDYIYLQSDMATFAGRKFHGQKNHLNAFYRNHPDTTYEVIDTTNAEECLQFALEWCDERSGVDATIADEKFALQKAFKYYDELQLRGGALRFNGKIQAMSIGDKFLDDVADLHFEKASKGERGLYVAMCQAFAKNAWSDVKYLNREEDMGLPGLKSAKQMLHPYMMWKKYTVTVK